MNGDEIEDEDESENCWCKGDGLWWMVYVTGVLQDCPICRSSSGKGTKAFAVRTAPERQRRE